MMRWRRQEISARVEARGVRPALGRCAGTTGATAGRGAVALASGAGGLLLSLAFLFSFVQVRGGMRALRGGRLEKAEARFQQVRGLRLLAGGAEEGMALLALEKEDYARGRGGLHPGRGQRLHLSGLEGSRTSSATSRKAITGRWFSSGSTCPPGGRDSELDFHLGCGLAGVGRFAEAARRLSPLAADPTYGGPARRLAAAGAGLERAGRFPAIADRGRRPLAALDLRSGKLVGLADRPGGVVGIRRRGWREALGERERRNVTASSPSTARRRRPPTGPSVASGGRWCSSSIPASGDVLAAVSHGPPGSDVALTRFFGAGLGGQARHPRRRPAPGDPRPAGSFPLPVRGGARSSAGGSSTTGCVTIAWPTSRRRWPSPATWSSRRWGWPSAGRACSRNSPALRLRRPAGGRPFCRWSWGGSRPTPASDYALASLSVGLDSLEVTPIHLALIAAAVADRGEI